MCVPYRYHAGFIMPQFGFSIEKEKELRKAMRRMKIFEKDIQEDFIRSSGPGGQNVNKVSTCVVLVHMPTGTRVKAQEGRTQGLNRYTARCRLIAKIDQKQKAEQQKIIHDRAKRKRQNRKRSRALKEKILEGKRQQSQKKSSRQKIRTHKMEDY